MARFQPPMMFGRGRPDLFFDPYFSLRSEIDRLFEDFGRTPALRAATAPRIDVAETEQAIEIMAELPGVKEDDLDLSVEENAILLRGERREEREEKKRNWYVQERSVGAFARRIELPFTPSPDDVKAHFADGVLTVSIQKPRQAKRSAQRIQIEGAASQRQEAGPGAIGAAKEIGAAAAQVNQQGAAQSGGAEQEGQGRPQRS